MMNKIMRKVIKCFLIFGCICVLVVLMPILIPISLFSYLGVRGK